MAILFELSESIIKRAALISSEYSDRSLLSIIEECFEYGAKSLYPDSKKPLPVQRVNKPVEEIYSQPPTQEEMNVIHSLTSNVTKQAQKDIDSMETVEEWSDSYSEPVIGADGLYEL